MFVLAGALLIVFLPPLTESAGQSEPAKAVCHSLQLGEACRAPLIKVAGAPSSWKFTRTQGSKEGESFAAIMKTADTALSDPDFAGLIVRCGPKGKIDVLLAIIRPYPPRSHPQVTVKAAGSSSPQTFEASLAAAGAAVLLPEEVGALPGGVWQTTPQLTVTVKENDSEIKGVIELKGLQQAYNMLLTSCVQ